MMKMLIVEFEKSFKPFFIILIEEIIYKSGLLNEITIY